MERAGASPRHRPTTLTSKPSMASSLALEGLESYDPPRHGDVREVSALNASFVYIEAIKGWVELALDTEAPETAQRHYSEFTWREPAAFF